MLSLLHLQLGRGRENSECPEKGRKVIQGWAQTGLQLFIWEIIQ